VCGHRGGLPRPDGLHGGSPDGPSDRHGGGRSNANWRSHGRDGYVRAWEGTDCSGTLLGATPGNDSDWSDDEGPFQWGDQNKAPSVMNSGYSAARTSCPDFFIS